MVKFEPWVWYGARVVMGKFESCTGLEEPIVSPGKEWLSDKRPRYDFDRRPGYDEREGQI